jgi:hypothetical protein
MARDIRLMKRPRMDNRFDSMVRKGALDHRSFGHRTDDVSVRSECDVQADRHVASRPEPRGEEPAEPSRRTSKQNTHPQIL